MHIFWKAIVMGIIIAGCGGMMTASSPVAYDMEMAKEICDEMPLEGVEGVWVYPDDGVTVMILRESEGEARIAFPAYAITVVETSDARLHPGEKIGTLRGTSKEKVYEIELSTERKNDILLKPKSCLATLSAQNEALLITKQKAPFKGRINFNFSRLLPGFWKIVSVGVSQNSTTPGATPPVGMVKVYPGYDGNGSTKREVRYL